MKQIKNTHYEGERPLFASHGLYLEEVTIHAGESALKECSDIEAVNCRFEGKYPFWHNDGFVVKNCLFTEGARAALWYSKMHPSNGFLHGGFLRSCNIGRSNCHSIQNS